MWKQARAEIVPVLICGGVGKRLWPLSREQYPKQMLRLYNTKTLIQNTLLRLQQLPMLEKPVVVCNKKYRFIVKSQIEEIKAVVPDILLEPKSMNTAPAIAFTALRLQQKYGDVLMLVLPVDHKLDDMPHFSATLAAALPFAEDNKLVTLGVKPSGPNPHYGYIEAGAKVAEGVYTVKRFTEKPDTETARGFLEKQNYYWNTGINLFRVERILEDFARFQPEILACCKQALAASTIDDKMVHLGEAFKHCPAISIDYAILEKSDNIYLSELQSSWMDIGNWQQLYELDHKNEQGNVLHGNIVSMDTHNCYIRTEHSLIATLGLEDCFVVETRDVTLIANKKHLGNLPKLVEELEQHKRSEATIPATVHRPWGYYTSIESGTNFQIKKIVVHPHQEISLQEHQCRSEHWVILKGKASIVLGHDRYTLGPNESTFVPIGVRHQIINNEDTDLELIEVQMGAYLGEDDIKRFNDIYHRDKADA